MVMSSPVPILTSSALRIGLHQMDAGIGEIVDIEEFAPRRAGAPHHDVPRAGDLRFVEAPDQGGDDVAVFGMIIVAAPVEIGRHHADEVGAVLAAIGLDHLDAGDLGDRIGLVGRLQRPRQHRILAQRLRRQLGIDAGRAEEHQLLGAVDVGGVDDVGRDREIVVEEFGAQRVVGDDAADLGRRQEDRLRAFGGKPSVHRGLIAQIDLAARRRQQFDVFLRQPAHQRGADHAAMAGDEDRLAFQLKRGSCHWRSPACAISRSAATISLTSWANGVFGFQPSFSRALLASPIRRSTSVGRK